MRRWPANRPRLARRAFTMSETGRAFEVAVVISLFDKAPFIADTLASVLAQSHPPREIIVVDDQSTDGGAEIVEVLAASHPEAPIRLIRQPNAGPGPARNRGAEEAAASWIALLDGDDLWGPDHLATLSEVAGAFPQADVVATHFMKGLRAAGPKALDQAVERPAPRLIDYFAESAPDSRLCTSVTAIRRRVFLEIGGFGSFFPGEDIELWVRLALDHVIAVSDGRTTYYVMETGGLMDRSTLVGDEGILQPVYATLDRALADRGLASRHPKIRSYRATLLRQTVRQALYRCDTIAARKFLDGADIGREWESVFLKILADLPAPLLRAGMMLRNQTRRALWLF